MKNFLLVFFVAQFMSCAHSQKSHETQVSDSQMLQTYTSDLAPIQMGASDHMVIHFAQGRYLLSRADRQRLGDLIETGNVNMQVDQVKVAAWSDKAFPVQTGIKLNDHDRALAESRAQSVDRYLRNEYQISNIQSYNMAENSNWLARAFNTQDAELKSLFSKEAAGPITNDDFDIIKDNGDAGSVVILIKRK